MARDIQNQFHVTCVQGVNEQADKAHPLLECESARNVWAPDGRVEGRPGYVGVLNSTSGTATVTEFTAKLEDTSGSSFTTDDVNGELAISGAIGRVTDGGDQDRVYIGLASKFSGFNLQVASTSAADVRASAQYYNGTYWQRLHVVELDSNDTLAAPFLGATGQRTFTFVAPGDWATTEVNNSTLFWIRFNLHDADLTATIDVDHANTSTLGDVAVRGLFRADFPGKRRYIKITRDSDGDLTWENSGSLSQLDYTSTTSTTLGVDKQVYGEPASIAVVPQFSEAYTAIGHVVVRHHSDPNTNNNTDELATVEDRDFAVGELAPYSKDYVVQLSTWPAAKYTMFFGGHIWAANLIGQPYTVRWSAAAPYHRVWPSLSFAHLMEKDNSPITGLSALGEFAVLFKRDSIWMVYPTGIDAFGLSTYAIRQVVAGVGCVSNSSIKEIRGNLIFLAEDGLYRFDGREAVKISDPVNDTLATIAPGRRPQAVAAHWRSRSCYLLSFATDSEANDTTVVFDYKNNSWWVWDSFDAQYWLESESTTDDETLYFGDSDGRVYQFDVGLTDNGSAITHNLKTHRLGKGSRGNRFRVRDVYITSSNKTQTCTLDLYRNDDHIANATGTYTFTDDREADWGELSWDPADTTDDDNWNTDRRRSSRLNYRTDCEWIQAEITHSEKGQAFAMSSLDVGYMLLGRR